jgi:hypothetical protein
VAVVFGVAFGDANYSLKVSLENTTDSPASSYLMVITTKTASGFTVTLSGNTDSANYILDWHAVHD